MGILGTIIGFYFAAGTADVEDRTADLAVAAIVASSSDPPAGTEVTLGLSAKALLNYLLISGRTYYRNLRST